MKILMTGGGTGGHFYPIIAVAEALRELSREQKLLEPKLYFAGPTPFDRKALVDKDIIFVKIAAGKVRKYFSILNFLDLFKTAVGTIKAVTKILLLYPDIIFGKGGYGSFPVLLAGKLLGIPVIIHESDTIPGRVNKWAGKFAKKVAISYPEAKNHFPKADVALTGVPVRKELYTTASRGAREYLNLEEDTPVILVLGGSSGARTINEGIVEALPELVKDFQVIHQTGKELFKETKDTAELILENSEMKDRYHPFDYFNTLAMRMAAGAANIVVSRAGSTAIFEIAIWGLPSIVIPIPEAISHDQRTNAFSYARSGAAEVVEEENFTPHLLISEIRRILKDPEIVENMSKSAKEFAEPEAAKKIAREILDLALEHEK